MKIENALVGTNVKCKKNFYLNELIGKVGVIVDRDNGFILVSYPVKYSCKLHDANGTQPNFNNFYILPSDLKRFKAKLENV